MYQKLIFVCLYPYPVKICFVKLQREKTGHSLKYSENVGALLAATKSTPVYSSDLHSLGTIIAKAKNEAEVWKIISDITNPKAKEEIKIMVYWDHRSLNFRVKKWFISCAV